MPNDDLADLYRRLSVVEQQLAGHLEGCGEMNRNRSRWERKTDANMSVIAKRVEGIAEQIGRILQTDARRVGYVMGATAAGSLLGGALVAVLSKILWGS